MARAFDSDLSPTQRVRDVRKAAVVKIAMKSPVFSMLNKSPKPASSTPEWVVKTYADPNTDGTKEVDVDTSADIENNLANRTMLKSRYQMKRRVPGVGIVLEQTGVEYATPGAIMADNVKDKTLELYVDNESVILSDNEAVAGAGATTASKTRGLPRWISNADARFTDADTTPAAAYRAPATNILANKATPANITEDNIEDVLQSIADTRKGEPEGAFIGLCSSAMRRRFGSFTRLDPTLTTTALPLRRFDQKQGTIDHRVGSFLSDFGEIKLMTSFRMDASVHFLAMDDSMAELGVVKAPSYRPLEDRGAGPLGIIDTIYVLMCLNPAAFAKATSTATA